MIEVSLMPTSSVYRTLGSSKPLFPGKFTPSPPVFRPGKNRFGPSGGLTGGEGERGGGGGGGSGTIGGSGGGRGPEGGGIIGDGGLGIIIVIGSLLMDPKKSDLLESEMYRKIIR